MRSVRVSSEHARAIEREKSEREREREKERADCERYIMTSGGDFCQLADHPEGGRGKECGR